MSSPTRQRPRIVVVDSIVFDCVAKAIRDHSPEAVEQSVRSHMDLVARRLEVAAGTETPDARKTVARPKMAVRQRSSKCHLVLQRVAT